MDSWLTLLVSVLSSGAIAFALVKWLAERTFQHGLAIHLESYKADLNQELTRLKSELDMKAKSAELGLTASLRRADELILGEESAERAYRYEARKRLYGAVGPLRFQLIVACIQFLSRLQSMRGEYRYGTTMNGYFGRSFLFRLAKLLALMELIENQIAYADFSVDPAMMQVLRFRGQALRALSSADVPMQHPGVDWSKQKEHIFRDQIGVIAVSMISADNNGTHRVIRFDEFEALLGGGKGNYLQPLTGLVARLDPTRTPIFWLRLLALGQACEGFLQDEPVAQTLAAPTLDYRQLMNESHDSFVRRNTDEYIGMLADFREKAALPVDSKTPKPR